jgi:hypothetical protein
LSAALAVNGQDEICDSLGGEDCDFGIRLDRLGAVPMFITKACATLEDEYGHWDKPLTRLDKPWPGPEGPFSSNALVERLQRETSRVWTIGNDYTLQQIRDDVQAGKPFPIPTQPTKHWVDDQPLSEM